MTKPIHIAGDPRNFAKNPYREYASSVSPVDEARMFPLIYQKIVNQMPQGLHRSILSDMTVMQEVLSGANDAFMQRNHPGADCHQTQSRFDMRDHMIWRVAEDELFALDDPEPESWLEGKLVALVDWLFPERQEKRRYAAASLRIEKMVAKTAIVKLSVCNAMLHHVSERMKKDRVKAA